MDISETEKAYIAGFLDGEGNITILARNRNIKRISYGLYVGFTNRDLRPLLAIKKKYGGNLFWKKRYSKKHSQAFELRIGNRKTVVDLLTDALPYLMCKKEQAELGLAFLSLGKVKRLIIERIVNCKGGTTAHLVAIEGEQQVREEFKNKLMLLNKRGV